MSVDRGVLRMAVAGLALATGVAVATVAWAQGEWKAPAEAHALKSPITKLDAKERDQTKRLVETNCTPCHGSSFRGDGPAAAALPTKPADWTSEKVQKQSDGEIFWKISNGRGAMPPWSSLAEKERWEIVSFIRSLKK
jgi:mono/diheme cytochrome c family protein